MCFYTVYNLRNLREGIKDIMRTIDLRDHYNIYKNMLRLYRIEGKEADYRPSKHHNGQSYCVITDAQLAAIQSDNNPMRRALFDAQMRYYGICATI
jgi:hypothetical protein